MKAIRAVLAAIAGEADTLLFLIGAGLVVSAAWMVAHPLAFLVAGVFFCLAGYSLMLRKSAAEGERR